MSLIQLEGISRKYKMGENETKALDDIDFSIEEGEFLAVMGPSGSGKSTLLNVLGLLDRPTSGTYILNGKDVTKYKKRELAHIRNQEIGFVFQKFNLLPRTNVLNNVLLPSIYGSTGDKIERANYLINEVGLSDKIKNKSNELSGGQIQRVAIARALMMNPSLILADEPTGNLDSKTGFEIMSIFKKINKEQGATIVVITHEDEVATYADRIVNLRDGKIISDLSKEQ